MVAASSRSLPSIDPPMRSRLYSSDSSGSHRAPTTVQLYDLIEEVITYEEEDPNRRRPACSGSRPLVRAWYGKCQAPRRRPCASRCDTREGDTREGDTREGDTREG